VTLRTTLHAILGLIVIRVVHADTLVPDDSPTDFSISAPRTWTAAGPEVVAEAIHRFATGDLKKILEGARPVPVVTFFRYPPNEYTGENPSVKVLISETPEVSPSQLLAISRDVESKVFVDYKIESDVRTTEINDIPGATMAASFTSKYSNGRSYPTLARVWAIRRGRFMYVIGTSGPENPSKDLQKDFDFITSSFHFTSQ
jgi:hypothetical protein